MHVMEIWADDVFFFDEFNLERTKTINEKTHIILKCSNHLSLVQNFNNNHTNFQITSQNSEVQFFVYIFQLFVYIFFKQ